MRGGTGALHEAELMVRESVNGIIHRYRKDVAGNAKRLGRLISAEVIEARAASRFADELTRSGSR